MTTDTVGGVWTYSLELANALSARGVETTLVAMGAPLRRDQRDELERVDVAGVFAAELALEWMPDPWDDLERAGSWLLEISDRVAPDLVHLNSYGHAGLPWQAPVLVVGHSCVLSWFEAVRGQAAGAEWDPYRRMVAEGLAAADLVVAPTRWMLNALERHYGLTCPRLVIPNGRREAEVRAEKQPLVLSAGRLWDEAKNVAALVRIAPGLPWPVLLAGEGGPRALSNVTRLGRLSRRALDLTLARAGIYAAPARYEPFGLGPLEAALAGCALVLGDITTLREVWRDAAVYAAPDDDAALAEALRLLIDRPDIRADLASRGRARAAAFNADRMADGYLGAYRRLLRRQRVEVG
jgi:glycosyltransferase involved in cell wall biosynthesis